MGHFNSAQLASILEMHHATSEMRNKNEQKQQEKMEEVSTTIVKKSKRQRVKSIKKGLPITSSNRHRAFMMNEYRVTHSELYTETPKKYNIDEVLRETAKNLGNRKPYYKFFGKEVFINENEVNMYIEHGVTIFYK